MAADMAADKATGTAYLADRLALRDLVETYAHGADRRKPELVASMFLPDGSLTVHRDPGAAPITRTGREQIAAAMAGLDRYIATQHLVANQLATIDGDRAEAETYCTAHHIYEDEAGVRRDRVMAIRYVDTYARTPEGWRIATRTLHCDWVEDRPLTIPS
ncbi:nuclear transport factor 2 family protein [Yinghuangia seranimata]|uniref:nuclear transport factor 2 family protein n=1 Tax=Yinghuangia seranimata TaxID=408067 RepID=UPI00248AB10D|nr:nuclear transport factor 2 family protein [Yinghuangia seranimata]MDI2131603.1 nuclear transport factor 2 family protein [Yinghuangia seranimata]